MVIKKKVRSNLSQLLLRKKQNQADFQIWIVPSYKPAPRVSFPLQSSNPAAPRSVRRLSHILRQFIKKIRQKENKNGSPVLFL